MLPPGVKKVSQIKQQKDPITRVHEAKRLLEYLLDAMTPGLTDQHGREAFLGDRVREVEKHFSDVRDVMFAIGVRNKLDHPSVGEQPPAADEIERAGLHLIRAIEDILPHAPTKLATAAGYRKPAKKKPTKKGSPKAKSATNRKSGAAASPQRKPAQHPCRQCGRKFNTAAAMKQHTGDAHGPGKRRKGPSGTPRRKKKVGLLRRMLRLVGG
ncbi:MAG: hypothetical protein Q9O74_12445 [Planctomycetota bacterium]|nr:hypothetical protein [Planctomycetota bacterium]